LAGAREFFRDFIRVSLRVLIRGSFGPSRFQSQSALVKFIVFGIVVSLTLILLWLAINFTFLTIYFNSYYGPVLGWPIMPNWIVAVGWIWTFSTVIFVAAYYGQMAKGGARR